MTPGKTATAKREDAAAALSVERVKTHRLARWSTAWIFLALLFLTAAMVVFLRATF